MKALKYLPATLLVILLAACLASYYATRDSGAPATPAHSSAEGQSLVDTSLLQTAVNLAASAATPDEQSQARDAWRLADHELDLRYAAAMRDAEAVAAAPPTGPLRQLSDRIAQLQSRVDADKKRAADLANDTSGASDRAQAQVDLDQDELDDAQATLERQGDDRRARLQRLVQEHEASDKVADQMLKFGSLPSTATLSDQLRAWSMIGDTYRRLQAAEQAAGAQSKILLAQHNNLQTQLPGQLDPSASTATLRQIGAQHKNITGLDQRVADTQQLAAVYQNWSSLVATRRRAVLHLIQGSLAAILGILLTAVLCNGAIRRAFSRADRRVFHQARIIGRIGLQIVAVLLILLITFGPPTQVSTMIGLITAGITVVMKDFIVAFFGWFTLMGKNGIRVGDWVEIDGVSGEVIEIGLLKTRLLEQGNWTESGHPTGRQVAFSNSFALEGHYFNFSTAGQWLWDELRLTLPPSGDPYATAKQIHEIVERETQTDAGEAVKEWQRVKRVSGSAEFSPAPTVNLRPAASGLEVVVRYITRAPQRNTVKSKLFGAMVDLLRAHA
jgi:small-conductance mechanosensitive channel